MERERKDVPIFETWDLTALYSDPSLLKVDILTVKTNGAKLELYKGKLNNPETILACLTLNASVKKMLDKIDNYVSCKANEDLSHGENGKLKDEVKELTAAFGAARSFIKPELASQPEAFLQSLIANPAFKDYDFALVQILASKKHMLSAESEAILARYSEVLSSPHDIAEKLRDADMKFPAVSTPDGEQGLTNSTFGRLRQHQDREVRCDAVKKFFGTYHGLRTTFTESLHAHVKTNVIDARLRKYPSILDSFLLSRGLSENVCDALFAATEKHLHLLHRYCEVRRKKLGVETLHWHDLYVPLVDSVNSTYTYDQAVRMVLEALAPLGQEYVKTLEIGLTYERWVDRGPNKGKRSGAYSSGIFDGKPYILANYDGRQREVSMLAHEAGHSMHTVLARAVQPFPKYKYLIFLAEIASTFNEVLLAKHLLKGADAKMRAFIVNDQLESIRTTFFRQTMFAQFEAWLYRRIWDGKGFSADDLEKEYYRLNQHYYGPKVAINPEVKSEWAFIPHFYYNLYVFQYATGIACASHFADRVISGGPAELENYLNLLRAGGSDYPAVLLKKAGLDIGKPDYLEAMMKEFERLLDEFEAMDLT